MCGFIAQLVEHRTGIAEVTGSNPFECPYVFLGFFFQLRRLLIERCRSVVSLLIPLCPANIRLFRIF